MPVLEPERGTVPAYLVADDYIEITGVPGSDLDGITLNKWDGSFNGEHLYLPRWDGTEGRMARLLLLPVSAATSRPVPQIFIITETVVILEHLALEVLMDESCLMPAERSLML
ncbi:MAG: hypothetical protein U5L96_02955 [Owenweeksia sp.]|nr:hypothetical protein [Owenweeksia sp.]